MGGRLKESNVITSEEVEKVVYDYVPRTFIAEPTERAKDYVEGDETQETDFQLSDLSARQAGITQLNKERQAAVIDELVLEKLKEVQEQAYREAYDLGVAEGAERAFVEMKEEFVARLAGIDEMLRAMDQVKKRLFDHNEAHLVQLTYLIARKISLATIEQDSEFIKKFVLNLLEEVHDEEQVVLKLSPDDLYFLEGLRDRNIKETEVFQTVRMEVDEHIEGGGCIVETNYGVIDATLDKRVDKIWDLLKSRFPKLSDEERQLTSDDGDSDSEKSSDDNDSES